MSGKQNGLLFQHCLFITLRDTFFAGEWEVL